MEIPGSILQTFPCWSVISPLDQTLLHPFKEYPLAYHVNCTELNGLYLSAQSLNSFIGHFIFMWNPGRLIKVSGDKYNLGFLLLILQTLSEPTFQTTEEMSCFPLGICFCSLQFELSTIIANKNITIAAE